MFVGEVKAASPLRKEFYRGRQVVEVWLPRIRVNRRRTLPVSGGSPSGLQECATREEAIQWARDFAEKAMRELVEQDAGRAALEEAKGDG